MRNNERYTREKERERERFVGRETGKRKREGRGNSTNETRRKTYWAVKGFAVKGSLLNWHGRLTPNYTRRVALSLKRVWSEPARFPWSMINSTSSIVPLPRYFRYRLIHSLIVPKILSFLPRLAMLVSRTVETTNYLIVDRSCFDELFSKIRFDWVGGRVANNERSDWFNYLSRVKNKSWDGNLKDQPWKSSFYNDSPEGQTLKDYSSGNGTKEIGRLAFTKYQGTMK